MADGESAQDIVDRLAGRRQTAQAGLTEATGRATAPSPGLNRGEAIFSAIASLLPVAIGATKGRQGIAGGAAAGQQALGTFLSAREQRASRERKRVEAEAKILREDISKIEKESLRQQQRDEKIEDAITLAGEKSRLGLGPKGTTIKIENVLEKKEEQEIATQEGLLAQGENLIKNLRALPSEQGNLFERLKTVGGTKVKALFTPSSPEGKVMRALNLFIVDMVKAKQGAKASDQDLAFIRDALQGSAFSTPADLAALVENALDTMRIGRAAKTKSLVDIRRDKASFISNITKGFLEDDETIVIDGTSGNIQDQLAKWNDGRETVIKTPKGFYIKATIDTQAPSGIRIKKIDLPKDKTLQDIF